MRAEVDVDLLGARAAAEAGGGFDAREFAVRERLEEAHYWHLYRREVVLELVRAAGLPAGGRGIELGCGTGMVATHLNAHGYVIDYGDVHAEALEAARRRAERVLGPRPAPARRFVRLDVARQFPSGTADAGGGAGYDAVLLLDVIEHLPDAEAAGALRAIRGGVRAGTLLVVTVPAFPFLWSPWDDVERHQRRYTRATLRAQIEAGGFAIERMTHLFFPLFFAASAVKGLRALRNAVRPPRPAAAFTELLEARDQGLAGRAMLRLLGLERRWLRRRDLPCGTSLAAVARAI